MIIHPPAEYLLTLLKRAVVQAGGDDGTAGHA